VLLKKTLAGSAKKKNTGTLKICSVLGAPRDRKEDTAGDTNRGTTQRRSNRIPEKNHEWCAPARRRKCVVTRRHSGMKNPSGRLRCTLAPRLKITKSTAARANTATNTRRIKLLSSPKHKGKYEHHTLRGKQPIFFIEINKIHTPTEATALPPSFDWKLKLSSWLTSTLRNTK
jgi:hypothetical protein